jgi:hypothetical protein
VADRTAAGGMLEELFGCDCWDVSRFHGKPPFRFCACIRTTNGWRSRAGRKAPINRSSLPENLRARHLRG